MEYEAYWLMDYPLNNNWARAKKDLWQLWFFDHYFQKTQANKYKEKHFLQS